MTDKNRGIDSIKRNIKKLEESKTPNALLLKGNSLYLLRIPYRTSTRLTEGIQYYNEKLSEYKAKNDSASLSVCYFVLSGFYKTLV